MEVECLEQFLDWWREASRRYIPLRVEHRVFDEDTGTAGASARVGATADCVVAVVFCVALARVRVRVHKRV